MKCKSCKNTVPDGSIYCNYCGEKLIRTKREKQKEVTVPKAFQRPSGTWFIQYEVEGERYLVKGATEREVIAKARAEKEGLLEAKKSGPKQPTLGEALDAYVTYLRERDREGSTIEGYNNVRRNRFKGYMDRRIDQIDWAEMVDAERSHYAVKTVKNAWSLVSAAVEHAGLPRPSVERITSKKLQREIIWLDFEQIETFLSAIKGSQREIDALLALHSLRKSEIYGLRWEHIDFDSRTFRVLGTIVRGENNELLERDYGKTKAAFRTLPIMIPRLYDLLSEQRRETGYVTQYANSALYDRIKLVCTKAGLPNPGVHGLRHSFASLGYHLGLTEMEVMELGGWSDITIVHRIYTHLAKQDRIRAGNVMSQFYRDLEAKTANPE